MSLGAGHGVHRVIIRHRTTKDAQAIKGPGPRRAAWKRVLRARPLELVKGFNHLVRQVSAAEGAA